MLTKQSLAFQKGLRSSITDAYRINEFDIISALINYATLAEDEALEVQEIAVRLVEHVRFQRKNSSGIDSFLNEYSLTSEEGIALMCLSEALLRVPDNATINSLIKDKLSDANWISHRGQSDSFFVNATTWALMLTGKMLAVDKAESILSKTLMRFINRSSEGVIRKAVEKAMRIMSKQFVMGRTIQEALKRAKKKEVKGYLYSYDMLGEAALTSVDAERYFIAYKNAIDAIGNDSVSTQGIYRCPGISIKLSALHPRFNESQHELVIGELPPKLLALAQLCKKYNIALTVDAEESERLELSLDVIERVFTDESLSGWNGFGMAVQSYQKRAFYVIDWIAELARNNNRRMTVRLIKGAYWDAEIKKAQMQGLSDYPVFTRKAFTDVSFQACVKKLLTMTDAIYPQFATHNAYSVALVLKLVGSYRDFEFQCLHGMGNELYEQIVPDAKYGIPCRIYAPVGSHEDLLPYLVRRLLENGANSSFVNRIVDEDAPISELVENPVTKARQFLDKINKNIPLPEDIFLPERKNSSGIDFTDRNVVAQLQSNYLNMTFSWEAKSIISGKLNVMGHTYTSVSPQDNKQTIGHYIEATPEEIVLALDGSSKAFGAWSTTTVKSRAAIIQSFATLLESNRETILALLCLEAGKTWNDGVAELREAVDFCHYYSSMAEHLLATPRTLVGYTGEINQLSLHGRGTVLCISPWNFPLAIFVGQIVAALVTGNCVIAKPAEQTPLIAYFAVNLLIKAGVPVGVVQLLLGDGARIGEMLITDKRVKAVMFTGSNQTASIINTALVNRGGEIIPFIAETGGQNAMIVDSSALLEQVVVDVITSAFGSAGQRCSGLRVTYIQEEVYPRFVELLKGAMAELDIGNPAWLSTDVGPVIDKDALYMLERHVDDMKKKYDIIYQCELSEACSKGYFMPPTAIAIDSIQALDHEVFGPVLHVISYKRKALDNVISDINNTGYGLTLGIHSRINHTVDYIRTRIHVGNCYVNRNMTGAVVGLQPFGGEGLSGTGPKAGGPYYLQRLCYERTFTVDTTAAGGNASLMSLSDN